MNDRAMQIIEGYERLIGEIETLRLRAMWLAINAQQAGDAPLYKRADWIFCNLFILSEKAQAALIPPRL